ncbi:hypothetical protein Ait01nite_071710 [Actinoplanes italicus]|uniref:DUF4034 domain-containing protein n=1 Tax=Actinoplanes italicus TaxID=113567 RepID=A0A2T0KAW9_9ACTN|nr:DUF4034 domain-containing protein [Actinoplanes italicus]PRX20342.1 hypothetical protein CLV67_108140 [Actinoplanes italicus]GIE34126.1 hypothetical protein Ait01nite_071710 [Actinoplanes italicus]
MWPFDRTPAIDPTHGDPRARALVNALTVQDRNTVRACLADVHDPDARAFLISLAADVPGVQDWIPRWIEEEPDSTLPLLIRGCHGVWWAWEARGAARAEYTSKDRFEEFFRRLRIAENCLDEVTARTPEDTTAWAFLTASARGRQVQPDEAAARFDAVLKYAPEHVMAHEQRLQYLCKKWFGSHEEMFSFARAAAGRATPGSLVHNIIPAAHIEYWLSLPSGEDQEHMRNPQVRQELVAATYQSVLNPAFRFVPGWPSRANTFAMALHMSGEYAHAARVFDLIGDHVTEWPWEYRGNAAKQFVSARKDAYAFGR